MDTGTTAEDRRRSRLERASAEWRSGLIDVSGNNRLLFFKRTATTVDLADAAPEALTQLLAGKGVRLTDLFPDLGRRTAAQRACKALAAKQREATEEYGIGVAYLALGTATWHRRPDSEATDGVEGDEESEGPRRAYKAPLPPAAPVLLCALGLVQVGGTTGVWELTLEGEPLLNPVLAHVVESMGADLSGDDPLGDGSPEELHAVPGRVAERCRGISGFRVDSSCLAGAFSYLKQPMVADVADVEAMAASDLVAALAGDETALAGVRSHTADVPEDASDRAPVSTEHLVLDADASQAFVVNAALAGRNLVVQGPPGTGKSQTIANVIAALVADGKSVLFVAQKRAAITAVLDRLVRVGLGDLVLDMFATGGQRSAVLGQIRAVLDGQTAVGAPETHRLHAALTSHRDRLVGHRDALHAASRGWGVTVHEALGLAYEAPPTSRLATRLPDAVLTSWDREQMRDLVDGASELAARGGLRPDLHSEPGWAPAHLTTTALLDELTDLLIALRAEVVPAHREAVTDLAHALGTHVVEDGLAVRSLLDLLRRVADAPPAALDPQLDDTALTQLLAATDKAFRREHQVDVGYWDRRRQRKRARGIVVGPEGGPSGVRDLHAALVAARDIRAEWAERCLPGAPRPVAAADIVVATTAALAEALVRLQPAVQGIDLENLGLEALDGVLAALAADTRRANYPRIHELDHQLRDAGCAAVLADLRQHPASSGAGDGRWAGLALQHAAAVSVVERALMTDRRLAGLTSEDLDAASRDFTSREVDHLAANAARVRRAAAARLKTVLDRHGDQWQSLRAGLARKRRLPSARALLAQSPDAVLATKPVWAMSPLQVSQFLPAQQCFDVVIFDEASQVRPPDAVPALMRARQALIAGDSRQLPPTEFFTKVIEDDDPEASLAEARAEGAALGGEAAPSTPTGGRPPGETLTRGAESILAAWDVALLGQSRTLRWHYRSRDERLIAVSNAHVYGHQLITVPAADTHDALRHVVAPDSRGVDGGTNSPAEEVRAVVDLVLQHARERPGESLGVITLGLVHARRVEAAVEVELAARPELRSALDADPDERFFVKNVERVQGDERDAVILSLGYGKGADGRLPMMWGPLLKESGERRLNVAISRARRRMALVTSFDVDDLADDAHHSEGYQLMRHFVRFMATDGEEVAAPVGAQVPLNPFEQDIHRQLVEAGLDVAPQLGVGAYRLDFAVRHPERRGQYVLAVEADGASYHSGATARERDRLRQWLLEDRGWTFHRIWSTDWFNDPRACMARLLAAYSAALTSSGGPTAATPAPTTSDAPTWSVATPTRRVPVPRFHPGRPITEYDDRTLIGLVRHIRSDQVLRTREQEFDLVMQALGFVRRGARIVTAIEGAQIRA